MGRRPKSAQDVIKKEEAFIQPFPFNVPQLLDIEQEDNNLAMAFAIVIVGQMLMAQIASKLHNCDETPTDIQKCRSFSFYGKYLLGKSLEGKTLRYSAAVVDTVEYSQRDPALDISDLVNSPDQVAAKIPKSALSIEKPLEVRKFRVASQLAYNGTLLADPVFARGRLGKIDGLTLSECLTRNPSKFSDQVNEETVSNRVGNIVHQTIKAYALDHKDGKNLGTDDNLVQLERDLIKCSTNGLTISRLPEAKDFAKLTSGELLSPDAPGISPLEKMRREKIANIVKGAKKS